MKRNNKKLDSKDPRYMTEEQEQIVNLILSNNELKSGKDVSNIFNELRGKVIQRLLDAEMEAFLGYDKSEHGEKESSFDIFLFKNIKHARYAFIIATFCIYINFYSNFFSHNILQILYFS